MSRRHSVSLTVDLVALTVRDGVLCALVIERGHAPYRGQWALPGGYLEPGEDLDAAAARELAEETGIAVECAHLEQLGTYGAPDRDPRGRVVTVAYLAFLPDAAVPVAGDDAAGAAWKPVAPLLDGSTPLAFDHGRILADAVERARAKLEYTTLAMSFCGDEFTIAELRRVYQAVWGVELDQRNFHRKITGLMGSALIPTGATTTRNGGRPAALYRRGETVTLHPAILRP
ncbi:NUDIX hydrolase [Nocardia farcinica]|uniref:NUDIX hydrolase n=1 Tax=Nocardia farcinica TaxID=37329 RepID=UPI002B4AADCB|nr:NUDIX domain-containing protein [Nocardia farcinica]